MLNASLSTLRLPRDVLEVCTLRTCRPHCYLLKTEVRIVLESNITHCMVQVYGVLSQLSDLDRPTSLHNLLSWLDLGHLSHFSSTTLYCTGQTVPHAHLPHTRSPTSHELFHEHWRLLSPFLRFKHFALMLRCVFFFMVQPGI